jgi:hypothetical protein
MGALLERLRIEAGALGAAPWAPGQDGEGIEGVVVSITTREADTAKRRSAYQVVAIDLGPDSDSRNGLDRYIAWHAAGDIAAEQLTLHRPAVGDRIAVLYAGEHRSGSGNRYKRWAVAVERATEQGRIQQALNDITNHETRHRAKRTFARLFGTPVSLPPDRIEEATAWIHKGIADGWPDLDAL